MPYQQFQTISRLVEHLNSQVSGGRVPHARMIIGKTGAGALAAAMAHAAMILSEDPNDETVWKLGHPDLHFTFPIVLKSGVSSSDDYMAEWREMVSKDTFFDIRAWTNHIAGDENKSAIIGKGESERIIHKLNLKSYLGGNKVLIVWGADLMHTATANKLLKMIEEPPSNTYIILLAENYDEILPTIVSRCQMVNLPEPDMNEMAESLVTKFGINSEKARNLAGLSEGDWYLARLLLEDQADSQVFHDLFVNWMRLCYKRDVPSIVDWVDQMSALKREKQKNFILYSLNFFRQCMLDKYLGSEKSLLFGNERAFAGKFGKFVHGGNIVGLMEVFDQEHYHLERNGNAKLIFLDLSFNVMRLLRVPLPFQKVEEN